MVYVWGFVAAVPAANKDAYIRHTEAAAPMFDKLGVTRMVEAWGDDVPRGERTDFYRAVQARDDEVVVFSFQEYADKEASSAAGAAMMEPEMQSMAASMPFDGACMIFGGFEAVYDRRGEGTATYMDGSVLPVRRADREAYIEEGAKLADLIFEHGAVRVLDAWGDDVPKGEHTDFYGAVAAGEDETMVFSVIEWPDKATRDAAWEALYQDPRMHEAGRNLDESRCIFGGFVPIFDA